MKINERLYDVLGLMPYKEPAPGEDYVPVPSTPFEVQQCGKHSVELYYMNDYADVLKEFTAQGKFAVWSSKDGVNYRLAVEKNYFEKLHELYTVEVNEIWLGFWDKCDTLQSNFSRHLVLPLTIGVLVLFLLFANWNNFFKGAQMQDGLQLGLTLGIPFAFLIVMMFLRKNIYNKVALAQQESLAKIKELFGENKYTSLLKNQRTYIDEYFDNQDDKQNETKAVETSDQATNVVETEDDEVLDKTEGQEEAEDNKETK